MYPKRCGKSCGQYWNVHKILNADSFWNMLAHADAEKGKWTRNWRIQWVTSTLRTTSEHGVSSITTADAAHLGCQQSTDLTLSGRFKWTRPFRTKTKSCFCACAITFHLNSAFRRTHRFMCGQRVKRGHVTRPFLPNHFPGNISIPKLQPVLKPQNLLLLDRKTIH